MLNPTLTYTAANALSTRSPSYCVEITPGLREEILKDSPSLFLELGEESGTTASDASDNELDGTYQASPTLGVRGPFVNDRATGVRFNGSTQYVSIADDPLLDPADTQSGEAWVRPTVISGTQTIFGKGANSLDFYIKSTGKIAISKNGTAEIVEAAVALTAGVWAHVAYTKSGATSKLYINGQDVTSTVTNQTIAANASAFAVGATSGGGGSFLNGSLCRVALYSSALSEARVRAHHNAGRGVGAFAMLGKRYTTHHLFDYLEEVLADNPSLFLRMGEASGTTAADASGNGLDGTYTNTPTLGVTGALAGDENTAITLTAADSEYVVVADNALLDPGDTFTEEVWINPSGATDGNFFSKGNTSAQLLIAGADMKIYLFKQAIGQIVRSTVAITAGVWSHVVATKSGSDVHLYINGVDVTGTVTNETIAGTATALNIGRKSTGAEYFNGSMDELAIYPTALSASRIQAHYDAGRGLRNLPGNIKCMNLSALRGISAQVEPDSGRSTVSSIMLPLIDQSIYDAEVLADAPSIYLPLSEKSGVVAYDAGGNCLHGSFIAAPTFGNAGPLAEPNTCLTLNGATQYGAVRDTTLLDPGDTFTLEAWVKLTAFVGDQDFLSKGFNGYRFYANSSGVVKVEKYGSAAIATSLTTLLSGTWYHVAWTKSGATNKLYINGVDVTNSGTNQTIAATAFDLNIGRNQGPGGYFGGSLARVAIYPAVLSADRIKSHYISGSSNVGSRGAVTRLLYEGLNNRQARFMAGFTNVCYSDFASVQRGVIEKAPMTSDLLGFDVTLRDPSALTNKTIFDCAKSTLAAALGTGAASLSVARASGYGDSGHIRIGDEYLSYSGKTATGIPPEDAAWSGIAYGAGVFVGVATDGAVATSEDGKTWEGRVAPEGNSWNGVCWSEDLGLFVAVASTGTNRIMTSPDGAVWTSRTATGALSAVCWSSDLGLFVAVGYQVSMTSTDGITWTPHTTLALVAGTYAVCWSTTLSLFSTGNATSADGVTWVDRSAMLNYTALAYSPALTRFVAVGDNARIMTSDDYGVTWIVRNAPDISIGNYSSVAWAPSLNLFVAVYNGAFANSVDTSPDGITWTNRSAQQGGWQSVCWSTTLSKFVAVGSAGSGSTNRVMTSTDGITWTSVAASSNGRFWKSVVWAAGLTKYVAVASDASSLTGAVMYSADGSAWTAADASENNSWQSIAFDGTNLVAVANTGTNRVMTSTNATAWTNRSAAEANPWANVIWDATNSLFVAVSRTGTNRVMTSPTGTTWTARAHAGDNSWQALATSGSKIIAVCSTTGSYRPMTSANGTTWAAVRPVNGCAGIVWAPTLSLFVAANPETSADGIAWIARTPSEVANWVAIIWSSRLSLLVAVSTTGTNRVATSPDATTWTGHAAAAANQWVALAEDATRVVALSNTGTVSRAMSSADALAWYLYRSELTGLVHGVTLANVSTTAVAHAVGASVSEVFHLGPAHIVDLIEGRLTSTDKTGVSMPPALVDFTKNAAVKAAMGPCMAEFVVDAPVNCKSWIEDDGCMPFGLYPGIGELWSLVRIAADAAAVDTLTDADLPGTIPQIDFDPNYSSIINKVVIQYDWNPLTQKFDTTSEPFERGGSIVANGEQLRSIQSKGLRTYLAGTTGMVAAIAERLLDRYENGAPKGGPTALLQKNLLEPGDTIEWTCARVPDLATGVRGISAQRNEVVNRALQYSAGTIKFELMKVG